MDDQALIGTYGNTDLPEGTEERPLVTFALFAYNQESYIREAVEGAFAQTYSPLEIILSDDCSKDNTFDILKKLASEYSGPHRVIVRRNPVNLMTALHVQCVASAMAGEIMVVAAGDDISLPKRVERIIQAWINDGKRAVALHSYAYTDFPEMNAAAQIAKSACAQEKCNLDWYIRKNKNPILSPTAAYTKRLFLDYPQLLGGSVIEDGPLVVRSLISGYILGLKEPLLIQRKLAVSAGTGYTHKNLPRWNGFVRSKLISAFNKLQDIPYAKENPVLLAELRNQIRLDIKGLVHCILDESDTKSPVKRMVTAVKIALYYPSRVRMLKPSTWQLRERCGFALKFTEFYRKKGSKSC